MCHFWEVLKWKKWGEKKSWQCTSLIREENVFLRRAAVETQLSVYFMYRIAAEKKIELDLEADSLREYIYQNILKLLG